MSYWIVKLISKFLCVAPKFIQNAFASFLSKTLKLLVPNGVKVAYIRNRLQIIADIPEDSSGLTSIKLKANYPKGIHLLQISPQYINVLVK